VVPNGDLQKDGLINYTCLGKSQVARTIRRPAADDDARKRQTLWDVADQIPQDIYAIIKHWARAMAEGMARTSDSDDSDFFTEYNGI